jgi:hypothetical protein
MVNYERRYRQRLDKLQVSEDSKFLMDWANGMCQIENLVLIPIMNRILR